MSIERPFPDSRPRALSIVLAVGIGLIGGFAFDRLAMGTLVPRARSLDWGLIRQAWTVTDQVYVDRAALDTHSLTYGAISGMVDALGDTGHSRFLSPEMVKMLKRLEQNKFEGIGAEVRIKDGRVVIVAPIQGSPAQKAGLQPGDIILKVDGDTAAGQELDRVVERIIGPPGTQVTLTILTPASGRTRDVTLARAVITLHEVTWRQLPGTSLAHLHVANFDKGVSEDLRKALADIRKSAMHGLILDLRNNPGGLLSDAVDSASQFLSSGNVLLEKNARGTIRPIPAQAGSGVTSIPMAVLVNGGTASAAEIVAGALQDAGRATLIGEKTFGTGTVLSQFGLQDGSALLLAVEEWLTPGGHTIWHKGIVPNIAIGLPEGTTPLFPESEDGLAAAPLRESSDRQLLRAIETLGW